MELFRQCYILLAFYTIIVLHYFKENAMFLVISSYIHYRPGSVICEGHVEVDTNGTSPTTLLTQVGIFISMQSSFDPRTPTIQATDIIIGK